VEGVDLKTGVENAFLEALSRKGVNGAVSSVAELRNPRLRISVLDQSVSYLPLSTSQFERRVKSTVEARFEDDVHNIMTFLGVFSQESVDTVATRGETMASAEPDENFFEHVLAPIVLVAASVVIVYLFFTVRS